MSARATYTLATAAAPGAIGIIQLHGEDAVLIVEQLIGRPAPTRSTVADFSGIDEGLVAPLPGHSRGRAWQLMPHGGPRVMQRLAQRLEDLGARPEPNPPARQLYPEAASDMEADMLAALARAASPAAIDRFMIQPRLWRAAIDSDDVQFEAIERHTAALDRLIMPPTVVVVGRANVGKSTLSNLVMGRSASITADLPGTTRDWVAGLAELPTPIGGLAVRWFDTPGLRDSDDPIEQRAIELARTVIAAADVLIAMRDPEIDWPPPEALPREPNLWVMNKADLASGVIRERETRNAKRETPLRISAREGLGLDELAAAIAASLDLADLPPDALWAFSPTLKDAVAGRRADVLPAYLAPTP